jgi:hypothetical protein
MELHFFAEIAVEAVTAEEGAEPEPDEVKESHRDQVLSTMRPTAPESRFQLDSAVSCCSSP